MKNQSNLQSISMAFFPLPVVVAVWMACAGVAAAQASLPSAADLELQRARTRASLDDVTADRLKSSDTASSFGKDLPSSLKQLLQLPTDGNPTAAAPRGSERPANLNLPEFGPVAAPVIVRRPAPSAAATTLPTPDFSRQSLTLGQLTGKAEIDLPEPENNFGTSAPSKSPSGLDKAVFSLPDLVSAGLDFSPEQKASRARQESANQRVSKTRADLFPTLSSRVAKGKELTNSTSLTNDLHDYKNTSVRLTQPLFNYPAFAALRATQGTLSAAVLRTTASQEEVTINLVQAIVRLVTARVTMQFSDELLENLTVVLNYQDQRAQSGASSQAELERARSRVLAARQSRLDQQASYKTALLEIERLMGFVPRAVILPYLNQLPPLPRTQAEIRDAAIRDNAEIAALRAEVEAQEAQMRAQYGRALPTVVASVEDDRSSNNGGVIGKRQDQRALVVMNWALSLGAREYFAGKEAAADLMELERKLEQNEQRVTQAVDTDFALLQAMTLRISLGQQEQESAKRVTEAVREQLKAGRIGSLLEALDASDRLYQARIKLVDSLSQQMLAQAQLLRHMGQLSSVRQQAQLLVQDAAQETSKK